MRRKTHELCCFLIGCVFKHVGSVGGNKLSEEESLRLEYYGTEVVDGHSERMKGNSSMNEFTRIFREISFHQTEHNYGAEDGNKQDNRRLTREIEQDG